MDKKQTQKHKYRIAAVGPYDVISLFKAFDIDCFDATNQNELVETLERLKEKEDPEYAIIFVPESILKEIDRKLYLKLTEGSLPTITPIPLLKADDSASAENIRRLAERAIGSDILK